VHARRDEGHVRPKLPQRLWMLIPDDLKRYLPRFEQELADRRQMIFPGIVLYGVAVYVASMSPNGWERVVPPGVGPIVAAIFLTLRPWNPYNSFYASLAGISSETVENDRAAQRLLALLRSAAAKRVIWRTAALTSASFLLGVWSCSVFTGSPSSWAVRYVDVIGFVFVQALLSLGPLYHYLLR
jgi:hypothetical protein